MPSRDVIRRYITSEFSHFDLCELYQGRIDIVSRSYFPSIYDCPLLYLYLSINHDFSQPEPVRVFRARISCKHRINCNCFVNVNFNSQYTIEELELDLDGLIVDEHYEF